MKILITGGTGYLGKHVINRLLAIENIEIFLLVREDDCHYDDNRISTYKISENVLDELFNKQIDCVLHLATSYGRNNESNEYVLNTNLMFPLSIIEKAIEYKVKCFFNMDTAIHKLINSYTVSKTNFRDWGNYFAKQGLIRFVNIKSEHFYGPFDNKVKFIANMLDQLKNNVPNIQTTLGEQERAFIYIDDIVDAIYSIINHEINNDSKEYIEYEVGPDNNIKIKDALLIMKQLTNSNSNIEFGAIPYRVNEEMQSQCDNSKLKSIGWEQKVLTFEDGIKMILEEENRNENLN